MFIEERHAEILKIISETGRISIGDIQQKFEVSVDSARRDLRILEEKGLLKRTHGGAIPLRQVGATLSRYIDMKKYAEMDNPDVWPNYAAVAKKAAEFIKENDIVFLTSGSLGFIMVRYLPKNFKYTLVVNSVALADGLKFWDNITVYVTGGKMRMHSRANMVDTLAANFVKNMRFDLNLCTGGGYNAEFGLSNGTDETCNFQRTVIEQSRKNIIMAPNQKLGITAFIKVCDADKFDVLVTDWDAVEDELAKIEELGVQVIVVEQEEDNINNIKKEEDNFAADEKPNKDDPMLKSAIEVALENGTVSTSVLQTKLSLGYSRAARIINTMEKMNIIGPFNGSTPRKVLITKEDFIEMFK